MGSGGLSAAFQEIEPMDYTDPKHPMHPLYKQLDEQGLIDHSPPPEPIKARHARFHANTVTQVVLLPEGKYLQKGDDTDGPARMWTGPFSSAAHFVSIDEAIRNGESYGARSFTVVPCHCSTTYETNAMGPSVHWTESRAGSEA